MAKKRRVTTEREFDLAGLRIVKRLLKRALREVEKQEKWMVKRTKEPKANKEEIKVAHELYQGGADLAAMAKFKQALSSTRKLLQKAAAD